MREEEGGGEVTLLGGKESTTPHALVHIKKAGKEGWTKFKRLLGEGEGEAAAGSIRIEQTLRRHALRAPEASSGGAFRRASSHSRTPQTRTNPLPASVRKL
jgi:hypothetical protein